MRWTRGFVHDVTFVRIFELIVYVCWLISGKRSVERIGVRWRLEGFP